MSAAPPTEAAAVSMARRGPGTGNRTHAEITRRDELGHKYCIRCTRWLAEGEFSVSQATADALAAVCKTCRQAVNHGLPTGTLAHWEKHGCMSCRDRNAKVVDHNHDCCPGERSCGRCVRGYLCATCNSGMGFFGDDPAKLIAAARYLQACARRRMDMTQMFRIEDYPLLHRLEQVFLDEIDRQYLNGEIEDGATLDVSAYFDPVSGEIQGIPNFNEAIKQVLQALWEEEGR